MLSLINDSIKEDFNSPDGNFFNLNRKRYKKNHAFEPLERNEEWKISLIKDLTYLKREATLYKNIDFDISRNLSLEEINQSLLELCTK